MSAYEQIGALEDVIIPVASSSSTSNQPTDYRLQVALDLFL
jgi:hypothetical protein